MALIVYDVAVEMIREIRPLIEQVGRHDKALAGQLRRSASSVPLNIAEGAKSRGGNEFARYQDAAGSASETRSALQVAAAWGYIPEASRTSVDELLDRVVAMLYRLTHRG